MTILRFEECEREPNAILNNPELPDYYYIKCHALLSACIEDWHEAWREYEISQHMWNLCRIRWPAATAHESTNELMNELRTMLDDLLEDLEAERPEDPELEESRRMHEDMLAEEEEERLREIAEDDEEMFAGVAEDEVDADEQ